MDLLAPPIEAYAARCTTPVGDVLEQVAADTARGMELPQMLSGASVGRLLATFAFAAGARRVLEVGTFTGYATIAIAQGMPPGGEIITCECDEETARVAQANFHAAGCADAISLRVGPALATIGSLEGPFDLVFIDADKTSYGAYLDAALPLLGERGIIAVDNTLWSGRVLDADAPEADADTRAIAAFNARVATDPDLVAVMLTVRDGVTLIHRRRGSRA